MQRRRPTQPHPNMKSTQLAAAVAGICLVSSAFALPTPLPVRSNASQPVPATVVAPIDLPRSLAGAIVNVEFKLDAEGRPQDVRLPSVYDPQVARQIKQAFSQWRFSPAASATTTRDTRFVLPLEIKS
jgi:hypothetical protein